MEQKNRVWSWSLGLLVLAYFLQGCATPTGIKQASKTQLDLIKAVNSAVQDFSDALDQYYLDKEKLVEQEGRMKIAQQSIDSALEDADKAKTVGKLYTIYQSEVEKYIDYGLEKQRLEDERAELETKAQKEPSAVIKASLKIQIANLDQQLATLKKMPNSVVKIGDEFNGEIKNIQKTSKQNMQMLDLLKGQLAVMQALQEKVDTWLSTDVSINQTQADAMEQSFVDANNAFSGGKQ